MRYSESTKNLFTALSKFQGEVEPILEEAKNPHFKNKYAKLEGVISHTKAHLKAHALVLVQPTSFVDGIVLLHTRVTHTTSGEYLEADYPLIPSKSDPQGLGAAMTYARRYCYLACLGLESEDDDGNAASGRDKGEALTEKLRSLAPPAPKPMVQQEMPPPGDEYGQDIPPEHRDQSAGQYVFTFGKHKGKSIAEVGLPNAQGYLKWMTDNASQSGKPLSANAQEAARYIAAFAQGVSVEQLELADIPF